MRVNFAFFIIRPVDYVIAALIFLVIVGTILLLINGVRRHKPAQIAIGISVILLYATWFAYVSISSERQTVNDNALRADLIRELPGVYIPKGGVEAVSSKPQLTISEDYNTSYRINLSNLNSRLFAYHASSVTDNFDLRQNKCQFAFLSSFSSLYAEASGCKMIYQQEGLTIYADEGAAKVPSQYGYYGAVYGDTLIIMQLDKKQKLIELGGVTEEDSYTRNLAIALHNDLQLISKDQIENSVSVLAPSAN